jgi:hypothetical protein
MRKGKVARSPSRWSRLGPPALGRLIFRCSASPLGGGAKGKRDYGRAQSGKVPGGEHFGCTNVAVPAMMKFVSVLVMQLPVLGVGSGLARTRATRSPSIWPGGGFVGPVFHQFPKITQT